MLKCWPHSWRPFNRFLLPVFDVEEISMKQNKLYFKNQRLEKSKRATNALHAGSPRQLPCHQQTVHCPQFHQAGVGFNVNAKHVLVFRRKILPDSTWERKMTSPPPTHTHTQLTNTVAQRLGLYMIMSNRNLVKTITKPRLLVLCNGV